MVQHAIRADTLPVARIFPWPSGSEKNYTTRKISAGIILYVKEAQKDFNT